VKRVMKEEVNDEGEIIMKSGRRIDKFLVVKKERILMENVGDVKEM
jgi:hypothetical protein